MTVEESQEISGPEYSVHRVFSSGSDELSLPYLALVFHRRDILSFAFLRLSHMT